MQPNATTRKEMIERLVEHSVAQAVEESQRHWMREVFENGFPGYSKLSDQQLRLEMELHGLDPSGGVTGGFAADEPNDDFPFGHC